MIRKGPKDDHCWHVIEMKAVKLLNPPIYPLICCNCGLARTAKTFVGPISSHGPHFTAEQLDYPKPEICIPKP